MWIGGGSLGASDPRALRALRAHITAERHLKERVKSRIAGPAIDALPCTDIGIVEGTPLKMGSIELQPLQTPGHTEGHFAYLLG
jgi:glyoxylase-like metal-dependent hydrolase (beta-lactamase superfamily II)